MCERKGRGVDGCVRGMVEVLEVVTLDMLLLQSGMQTLY